MSGYICSSTPAEGRRATGTSLPLMEEADFLYSPVQLQMTGIMR